MARRLLRLPPRTAGSLSLRSRRMHLFVGLGNPGRSYRDTLHNAGALVCERFATRNRLGDEVRKFQSRFRRGGVGDADVAVLEPQTYMNLSGDAVAEAVRYLPVEAEEIVLVWDDMDLPLGKLRLRKTGGHGGHNGVRSVIERLGTQDFARLRVGVGRPARGRGGHLLSKARRVERKRFSETVELAAEALEMILQEGFEAAMNRYNALPAPGEEGEGIRD